MKFRKKPIVIEAEQYRILPLGSPIIFVCEHCDVCNVPHVHTIHEGQFVILQDGD